MVLTSCLRGSCGVPARPLQGFGKHGLLPTPSTRQCRLLGRPRHRGGDDRQAVRHLVLRRFKDWHGLADGRTSWFFSVRGNTHGAPRRPKEVNPTNAGVHPLHSLTACSKRQSVEKAQLLLEHRADVDAQVSTAGTGIFACMCHSSQMISNMHLGLPICFLLRVLLASFFRCASRGGQAAELAGTEEIHMEPERHGVVPGPSWTWVSWLDYPTLASRQGTLTGWSW